MKLLALLIVFLIALSAMGKINRLKKNAGRTSVPEAVTLPFIYLGSCDQFYAIPHVSISSLSGSVGCLPLNVTSFAANDDLTSDVLCTPIGRNRAQIDFVEIYVTAENVTYNGSFAISFVPNAPFKAIASGVSYTRRPSCTTQNDYCSTTQYVHSCTESSVVVKNGFVISTDDEVFTIINGAGIVGCSQALNTCCGYINALYCPRNATNNVLNFNFDSLHEHHEEHHDHHDDHHDNDGDNDGDDRDHHHDDHHNDHHDNHHNDHHDNHHNDHNDHHDNHHNDHNDNHHNDHHDHNEEDGDNDGDDRDHHHDDFENDDKKKK